MRVGIISTFSIFFCDLFPNSFNFYWRELPCGDWYLHFLFCCYLCQISIGTIIHCSGKLTIFASHSVLSFLYKDGYTSSLVIPTWLFRGGTYLRISDDTKMLSLFAQSLLSLSSSSNGEGPESTEGVHWVLELPFLSREG